MFLNDPNNVYPVNIQTYPKVAMTKIEFCQRTDYTFRQPQTIMKYNEANQTHLVQGRQTRVSQINTSEKLFSQMFRNLSKKTDQNWLIIGERNSMID